MLPNDFFDRKRSLRIKLNKVCGRQDMNSVLLNGGSVEIKFLITSNKEVYKKQIF